MEPRKEFYRDPMTNEKITKKFVSQFDLVNYAIRLAENMIQSGRDSRVRVDCLNRPLQILGEIALGKDVFDEIVEHPHHYNDVQQESRFSTKEPRDEASSGKGEKKKSKRAALRD